MGSIVDEDLESMTRGELIAEMRRLREGIQERRDSTGHALCWHHPALWGLLPEKTGPAADGSYVARVSTRAACGTASPWTSRCPMRPAPTHRIGRDRAGDEAPTLRAACGASIVVRSLSLSGGE